MKWKIPSKIKVYEALGVLGDGRIKSDRERAQVFSSSRNKLYDVTYDEAHQAIMANDNASYWQGTLGYPAIAFLCSIGVVQYDQKLAQDLAGIPWKDWNTQFKNDFSKTEKLVLEKLLGLGWDIAIVEHEVGEILSQIEKLDLSLLGPKQKPPVGY